MAWPSGVHLPQLHPLTPRSCVPSASARLCADSQPWKKLCLNEGKCLLKYWQPLSRHPSPGRAGDLTMCPQSCWLSMANLVVLNLLAAGRAWGWSTGWIGPCTPGPGPRASCYLCPGLGAQIGLQEPLAPSASPVRWD